MPIIASDSGNGNFEKTPTGTQQAVCTFVEDIGTQEGVYLGEPTKAHQVILCWELSEQMKEGDNKGKPFMISKFYTLSLNAKANLRKDLESWRGKAFTPEELKGFDLENLRGANCLLTIITDKKANGKDYAKIASISPVLPNMEKITSINSEPPKWIHEQRVQSIEWKEEHGNIDFSIEPDIVPNVMQNPPAPEGEDDLPF